MSKLPYIVFGKPDIQQAEKDELMDSLDSSWLGTGPKVKKFEQAFANYKGIEETQVAAVNSCTAALHLSMLAAGLAQGDEVITTSMTFCATINAIIHAGCTPVLADINSDTYNIDPEDIIRKISPRTKAIVVVHYSGSPCDMDAIMSIARQYKLKVIEDCAHAIESEYKGAKLGTIGDFGCFSFYVTKNMTTGEGGMVIGKQQANIERIKTLALHGMSTDAWSRFSDNGYKHYQVVEPGFKYNMMDLQAALGIHQLARLDANWQKRQALFQQYMSAFSDLPIKLPDQGDVDSKAAFHLFPILIDEKSAAISRDHFMLELHKKGIGTGVHYLSIPSHEYYRDTYQWRTEDYPLAKSVGETTVSLPFSATLKQPEIDYIIETTIAVLSQ